MKCLHPALQDISSRRRQADMRGRLSRQSFLRVVQPEISSKRHRPGVSGRRSMKCLNPERQDMYSLRHRVDMNGKLYRQSFLRAAQPEISSKKHHLGASGRQSMKCLHPALQDISSLRRQVDMSGKHQTACRHLAPRDMFSQRLRPGMSGKLLRK